MNLVDDSVYWLAGALLAVGILGGGWLTSRTPRRARGVLLNILVVTLSSALAASGLFLIINRQNGWFTNWGDLFAQDGGAASMTVGSGTGHDAFGRDAAVDRSDARSLPPLPSPGQRVQHVTVPTSVGHADWEVTVILPADYFDPGSATRAYPVLMGGHGIPGSMNQFTSTLDMRQYGDQAVANHAVEPFITVVPNIWPDHTDTECITGPAGSTQMERWLAQDLPAYVKQHYRVVQQRTGWAWFGFSAGAWCAAVTTMKHPDVFGAAVILGGYFRPWWSGSALLTDAEAQQYDLIALATHRPPPVALFVQTTRQDSVSFPQTQKFLAAARKPTLVHAVILPTGGHNFGVWTQQVGDALAWLGQVAPGFHPA